MKLGIIANYLNPEIVLKVIEFIKRKSKDKRIKIRLNGNTYNYFKKELNSLGLLKHLDYFNDKTVDEKFDLIISFGGDGTMLYSGSIAVKTGSPLLGVNFGKLGFLADVDYDELDSVLNSFFKGEYFVEERIILDGVFVTPKRKNFFALNDIVIDKGSWPRIIQIETWINDQYLTTFSSDGLIISTPTGSTGYSLSTGGPILVPESNMFVLSPICPHTLTVRPIVVPSKSKISIKVISEHTNVTINADGHKVYKVKPPAEMYICKSEKTLKLVRKKNSNFFETLRNKLMWGVDLRIK